MFIHSTMYYVVCMGGASCKTLVEQFTTLPDIISQEMNLFDVINAFAVLHFAIISKLCWHIHQSWMLRVVLCFLLWKFTYENPNLDIYMLLFRSNLHSQIPPCVVAATFSFTAAGSPPFQLFLWLGKFFTTLFFTLCGFPKPNVILTFLRFFSKVTARIPLATAEAHVKMRPVFAISVGWVPTVKGEMKRCINVFLTVLATESSTPTLENASVIPSGRAANATSVSCQNRPEEGVRH